MMKRIKAPIAAVAAVFALSGCDLLDVNNPNSLVESSIQLEAASAGVANGSLRLVADAVADYWQGPEMVSDNLYWTGSRDAWNSLNQGNHTDPLNEFTDAHFPNLGQATWMAKNAVDINMEHVANNAGDNAFLTNLARSHMYRGIILMVTGENQEDMTFSDKTTDGAPVGPSNMFSVLDDAIGEFDSAITHFTTVADLDMVAAARALRARAHMSRAIWDQLNPGASVGGALAFPAALADAQAVLTHAAGADWSYNFTYAAGAHYCDLCQQVNERGENQIDQSLVESTADGAAGRTGVINLLDPVTGGEDEAVRTAMVQFGDDQFADLTLTSARLMRLIIAEDALAGGDVAEFETQINAIRAYDPLYTGAFVQGGAVSDVDMLQHTRRVNTLFMGLRLQDMFRWGLQDPAWLPASPAVVSPGEMLPITIVEVRANCHLNGQGCPGG